MIQVGFKTDKGKMRDNNEDSLFIMNEENIFIVADGVGGHNSGQLASSTAVKIISEYIKTNPIQKNLKNHEFRSYFLQCLKEANGIIYNMANHSIENAGMATTAVILFISDEKAYCINVGDSRAYIIRDGKIKQITDDHTYVNELFKEGSITRAEVETHPHKNMITRALGAELNILPDFFEMSIYRNDIFILCSDGLHGEVSYEEICRVTNEASSMDALSNDLINLANNKGGSDNITVICLKI